MLKKYQKDTLDALTKFLHLCATTRNIESSYRQCTLENFGKEGNYNNPLNKDKVKPYVCLRLPTGGGKTLLAAHTVSIACKEYLAKDFSLVVWLVPSNAILEQTYNTLNDKQHFYRRALDDAFEGKIEILKVEDALHISKASLTGQTNIIISTMASWRITNTLGRKVYEDNGSLQEHFGNVRPGIKNELEHYDDNKKAIKHSLANLVYLQEPIIIIDEAHNARTGLTFDTIERLNPSCIIEYTATPKTSGKDKSNVLYNISASVLKAEDMIKMPIELLTTEQWQTAVADSVKKQRELENITLDEEKVDGEYIRPIILIQAQHNSQKESTINVEEVKEFMLNSLSIAEDNIAVATGSEKGIEGIDLSISTCPIRYIITKQALKEGWDCPFAYIFCSVAHVKSAKDVEQLLGRVLRMPKVKRKYYEELNKAYAYVSSNSFFETAKNITDSLINFGFDEGELASLIDISPEQPRFLELMGNPTSVVKLPPKQNEIPRDIRDKVEINYEKSTLTFKERLTPKEKESLKKAFKENEDKEAIEQMFVMSNRVHSTSPQREGKFFEVPQLLIDFDGETRVFEEDVLLPDSWNLTDCNTLITETEFPVKVDSGTLGLIDVDDKGKPKIHNYRIIQEELSGLVVSKEMDLNKLINWLDKECHHYSVPKAQSIVYINSVIERLIEDRNLHIEHLVFMRFKLRDVIRQKINGFIKDAKRDGFYSLFKADKTELKDRLSNFSVGEPFIYPKDYPANQLYSGKFQLRNHYYDMIGDMNDEEEECAFNIDSHNDVDYWVRNLERQDKYSYWLQTATDKFYPDFVIKLKNGIIVVIEYKGSDRYSSDDSKEKRFLGNYWASLTNNKCRFIMLNGKDWESLKNILSIENYTPVLYT